MIGKIARGFAVLQGSFELSPIVPQTERLSTRKNLRLAASFADHPLLTGGVTIHDLSTTGMLIETASVLDTDDSFGVILADGRTADATVVWNSGTYYGCKFPAPLTSAMVSAALLKSPSVAGEERPLPFAATSPEPSQAAQIRGMARMMILPAIVVVPWIAGLILYAMI